MWAVAQSQNKGQSVTPFAGRLGVSTNFLCDGVKLCDVPLLRELGENQVFWPESLKSPSSNPT